MLDRTPEKQGMTDKAYVLELNTYCYRYLKKIGYDAIVRELKKGGITSGRIIDMGSGGGHLAKEIKQSGYDYSIIGIDISKEMIDEAIRNTSGIKGINFILGDVHAIPFSDNSFDAAVSFASLHHWEGNPALVFEEAYRVVRHDGMVIIYDLKRDKRLLNVLRMIPSKRLRELFYASVHAAYTVAEIREIIGPNLFSHKWSICETAMTIGAVGKVDKSGVPLCL